MNSTYICAIMNGTRTRVRTSVPTTLAEATTYKRQFATGLYMIGWHEGRRWGIVKVLNIWVERDGSIRGYQYWAYDLHDPADEREWRSICDDFNAACYRY